MMTNRIKRELASKERSPLHDALLSHCLKLIQKSHDDMSSYYSDWDTRMKTWKAERAMDNEDKKASKNNEPVKMIVPLTWAQITTFVAIGFMLLRQKPRFFELGATGIEDFEFKEDAEKLLERDWNVSKGDVVLFQTLLNMARFNLGVVRHSHEEQMQVVALAAEKTAIDEELDDEPADGNEISFTRMRKFYGNRIESVDPYHFYPDTRFSLARLQDGEFCASEQEQSKSWLKKMKADGLAVGIEYIEDFPTTSRARREKMRWKILDFNSRQQETGVYVITEMQVRIVPADFEDEEGVPLGTETYPVMYLVWIANDNRIIRFEPMSYLHDQFTYDVAEFTPDDQEFLSSSLAAMVEKIQSTFDWFVNSRVQSVRRTLDHQIVVDPAGIDLTSVENRSRVILMKKGASRTGIDRYIKQLQVQDVTAGHMADAGVLQTLMQMVTGVNDNAMGQYNGGRRSATESRVVTQSSSARLRMIFVLAHTMCFAPQGQKMLTNHRQSIDQEEFAKVCGEPTEATQEAWLKRFEKFAAPVEKLVGNWDLIVFDGTLPSEKQFLAQTLQELLSIVIGQPGAAQQFDLNPKAMVDEIMELRGVGDPGRFSFLQDPQTLQKLLEQAYGAGLQNAASATQDVQGNAGGNGMVNGSQANA